MSEKVTTKKGQPAEEQEEVKQEEVKAPQENVMYIGPSIAGVAQHSQVFDQGILPEGADKAIARLPQLAMMFVPMSKAAEAIYKLNIKKKNALKTVYRQCDLYFNGGK